MNAISERESARHRFTAGYAATLVLALLLAIAGAVLFLGGIWLLVLGGSFYYAIAGAGVLATAILLAARSMVAVWIYALTWVFTAIWAYWEVGFDWWGQVPRLLGPTIVLVLVTLCIPVLSRRES